MLALFLLATASAQTPPEYVFLEALQRMLVAVEQVEDATFVLHQQEYVGGKLGPPERIDVRYRVPNTVYMEWPSGQRLLWVPGDNNGKMRVDPGPLVPTLNLAPDGALAMRGQRHTIHRMGLVPVAELFRADLQRILADPERLRPDVDVQADRTLLGRTARCYDATMRRDLEPGLYGDRIEVCLDAETDLPVRMRTWEYIGGELQLVESYGYEDLRINTGMSEDAFTRQAVGL